MTAHATTAERFHALDALRAAMMFLGIYLHAVVAYSPTGGWPWRQTELTRIVVPFVVGWIVVWPLVALLAGTGLYNFDIALRAFGTGVVWRYAGPLHLWFLEYLIVLYALAVVVVALVPRVFNQHARQWLMQGFRRIVLSAWAPLVLAVPSFAAQLLMPNPWIEDPPGFMPLFRIVAVYAIPFAFGWLLFLNQHLLVVLIRRACLYAAIAILASVAYRSSYRLP